MEKLTSIFAAVEHPDSGTAVLDKAVALARHFDARVELLVIQPMTGPLSCRAHGVGVSAPDGARRVTRGRDGAFAPAAGNPTGKPIC